MKKAENYRNVKVLALAVLMFVLAFCNIRPATVEAAAKPMSLNKKTATLNVGKTIVLKLKNAPTEAKWKSNKSSVVKITDVDGNSIKICAMKPGKATITATVGLKKVSAKIQVKNLTVSKEMISVDEEMTKLVTVKNVNKKIKWSSSNTSVAKIVQKSGVYSTKISILGVSAGTATITGVVGNANVSLYVTVNHVHDFAPATCTIPETCRKCGVTRGVPNSHVAGPAATCTTAQTCTVCGTVLAQPLGHQMSQATCQKRSTCARCGHIEGGYGPHNWNYNTGYCMTEGCSEIDLQHFLVFEITNCGNVTDCVAVYVSNKGRFDLQICDNDGMAKVTLPKGTVVQARAWSMSDQRYINGYDVSGGDYGTAYFGTTEKFGLDFGSSIEFDIFYNHVKYHVVCTEGSKDGFTYTKL